MSFLKAEVKDKAGPKMTKSLSVDEPTESSLFLKYNAKLVEEQRSFEPTSNMLDSGALPFKVFPAALDLPPRPLPANECNFTHYYAIGKDKSLMLDL